MTVLYADTSALARAHLHDEPDHDELRLLLRGGGQRVVSSEVTRIEFARAVRAASRGGRRRNWRPILDNFELEAGPEGPIALISLLPERILPTARDVVLAHPVASLDAIHIAVALDIRSEFDDELVFVTRDTRQAAAAKALGLQVA